MKTLFVLIALTACTESGDGEEETPVMVAVLGQSNALGSAQVDDVTIEPGLDALYPPVTLVQRMAPNVADPPAFWDIAEAPLGPRTVALEDGAPLANPRMGCELTLGRALDARFRDNTQIVKFAMGGSGLELNWKPTAAYPTVGPNLYMQSVTWIQSQEAALATPGLSVVVWIQGNNDAANAGRANVYQANLNALLTALRSDFGDVLFVFDQLQVDSVGVAVATVRAQQAAFAAEHAGDGVFMINTDDLELRDGTHYTADSFVILGDRFAQVINEEIPRVAKPKAATLGRLR